MNAFENVSTLTDLINATRAAFATYRSEPRKIDSAAFLREIAESNAIAVASGHIDHHHALGRLSHACPTSHALAEQGNFSTSPTFIAAVCRVL